MTKYVKFIDTTTIQEAPKVFITEEGNTICNFNLNPDIMLQHNFKPLVEAKKDSEKRYAITYKEQKTQIKEIAVETVQDPQEVLAKAKEDKLQLNDTNRDTCLNQGIIYKDILFDSDESQKVNLIAMYNILGEEDTITWFGMHNQPLKCTRTDLLNIGSLIIDLHTYCWTQNATIKMQIDEASTLEELEAIDVTYNFSENGEVE